jgi:hypothetical protein
MANAAKQKTIELAADLPGTPAAPPAPPEDAPKKGKLKVYGAMIEDIMSNPLRGARAFDQGEAINFVETGSRYEQGVNTGFLDDMRELSRNGWLGDPARLELSAMGLDGRKNIDVNTTFARWLAKEAAYASNQKTPPDIIDLGGNDKLLNTRPRAVYYNYLYTHTNPQEFLPRDASGKPVKMEDYVALGRAKVGDDVLKRDIESCAKNEPQITVQRCAQVAASMGLRDQVDTGIRYNDIKMVTPPKTPSAKNDTTTGSIAPAKPPVALR